MSLVASNNVVFVQNSIVNSVRADDWTAMIASNEQFFL